MNTKTAMITIAGRPNVGKSTLTNYLVGEKIAIVSNKPQTTRNRIRTVYTCDRGQIVFVDTPGIHKSKNKLGDYMVSVARKSIVDVDAVIWIVEPTTYIGAGELSIIEELKKAKDVAVFLVINKMDTIKKDEVLSVIDTYSKQMEFAEIIPVSAKTGKGVQELIDCLLDYLPEGDAFFDEDTITDQPERQIVAELIREKALWCLEDEIPHGIAVTIESMNFDKKLCSIDATIVCERESHKGIIIGKGGSMLKKIGSLARPDIEDMLEMKVFLQLWVKVRKDWRDSDLLMKNYGYNPKDIQE